MRTLNALCVALVLGFVGMVGTAAAQDGAVALKGDNTLKSYSTTFDGNWRLSVFIYGGKAIAIPSNTTMEIRQGQMVLVTAGKRADLGSLETDVLSTQNVDVVSDRGREKGLYFINGETLTLCIAIPGQDRPANFASVGEGGTYLVLERI